MKALGASTLTYTREDKNLYQREYRRKTGNRCTFKYEKTVKGYLMRTYRNMLSRVTGVQKKKAHLYEGLAILDRNDFYRWSLTNRDYLDLHKEWTESGYDRKLSPSIDRMDPDYGYELWNMRWITHSENSANTRRNQ